MSKPKKHPGPARGRPAAPSGRPRRWWIAAMVCLALAVTLVALWQPGQQRAPRLLVAENAPPGTLSATNAPADTNALPTIEAAQSVVVTQDLDFGPQPPSLAEALRELDRRSQPADGRGRTFAILEAFNGEIQPDGKMRVSLRISTEKPGVGEVVFRRNGQVLWKSRILAAVNKPAFNAGSLTILYDGGPGKNFTVDGSANPSSILEARLKESSLPVAQEWADGSVSDLSFIYSACGCPIKVACRRVGDRTARVNTTTQVIFPDDPEAMQVITQLMRW